jgi:uncharacterized protein (DUF1684 family)
MAVCGLPFTAESADTAIGQCADNYEQCLSDWKVRRLEFLKGDDGYLNLAGLFWLQEGQNTFGSHASSDLVFPGPLQSIMGEFTLRDGQVMMSVDQAFDVRIAGRKVNNSVMLDDTTAAATVASYRNLSWTIIRRVNQFAVRLRDFEHPALLNFPPIDSYPVNEDYRINATLHLYPEKRIVKVDTVIAGLDYNPWSPGVVRFELDGESYELEAYDAGTELFIVFGDRTSGRETYPAGRFLYARKPARDGVLTLDFNTAHNPPCAFNEFATCPIASLRNRIPVRIPAGEKFDPARH